MKCKECCGNGYNLRIVKKGDDYTTERVTCEHCNGTGEVNATTEEFVKGIKEECKTMCYIRHLAERIESIANELSIYEDDRVYAKSMQKEIKRLANEIILELGEAAE